jgi:hypothetical protein
MARMHVRTVYQWVCLAAAIAAVSVASTAFAAKPGKGEGKAVKAEAADAAAKAETPPTLPGPPLPDDLNLASLRVHAIDILYELDLSVEQLNELRSQAAGAASDQKRTAAKGTVKLTAALQEFQAAALDGQDPERIDSLRNHTAELVDDDAVHLDDEIHITAAARGKAPAVLRLLTASQIAAYLAAHADEVGDPVEMMMSSLTDLREVRASETADAATAKKAGSEKSDSAAESASLIEDTAADVGYLVAGLDEAKAKELAAKVAKWLKANADLKDEEFSSKRKGLEESAKSLVSNIHPMRVLNNWLEHQLATLASNPQLPQAIDAMLAARQKRE